MLVSLIGLTGLSVATAASLIIHAIQERQLDPTTVELVTFLIGIVLGNTVGTGNGNSKP